MSQEVRNVIIIGSGPAGLTAAIYAARANMKPLCIEGFSAGGLIPGGQLMFTTEVENYPGFPEKVTGQELMTRFRDQAIHQGCEIVTADVSKVDLSQRPFKVWVEGEEEVRLARTVILATGAKAKYLGLPSEEALKNHGVSACAVCDGALYRNQPVAVVGGGDTAMEEASYLAGLCSSVALIHRRGEFRASKAMQQRVLENPRIKVYYHTVVDEVLDVSKGEVTGVRLRNLHTDQVEVLPVSAFFLAIGHQPMNDLVAGQLDLHDNGYVKTVPGTAKTSVPGVFAAGDVQDFTYRQAVTAAGSGCMAALEAERWLALEGGHLPPTHASARLQVGAGRVVGALVAPSPRNLERKEACMADHHEIRAEFRSLLGATRALIEMHRSAGALGLPESPPSSWPPRVEDLLGALPPPRLAVPREAPPSPPVVVAALVVEAPAFVAISSPSSTIPPSSMEAPDTVRTPEPPFGITGLPPEVSPEATLSDAPPLAAEEPIEAPPAVVTRAPEPPVAPPSPLFEDEPTQASLFGANEIPEVRTPPPARAADLPPPRTAEAHRYLDVLAQRVQACSRCDLHQHRKQTVFARGNPNADLCFVGEAPGADEDEQGLPFVGAAGQLLDRMIAAMGLQQDEVYVTNICRCRPPSNRAPTMEEMNACMPYLHEQIALVQPRVIVALGATATKGLLQTGVGIKGMRGTWKLYRRSIPVMPTFHPAYLLRETEAGRIDAKRDVWKDLQAVLERLGKPAPSRGKK